MSKILQSFIRSILVMLLIVACVPFTVVHGQSVTIGTGTITTLTTLGPMRSINTANAWNRHAYIYPASLLTGLTNGDIISSLEFERTGTNALIGAPNMKIWIKNTTANDWGSASLNWTTATTGAILVYSGNPITAVGTSAGFKAFNFTTNYTYKSTQGANLAIFVEYTQTTAQTTTISWAYNTSAQVSQYAAHQTKYINGSTGSPTNTLSSTDNAHPKIKINFPPTFNDDAAVTSITPANPCSGSSDSVRVLLINKGINAITSATINWTLGGVAQTPFNFTGNLASNQSKSVTIGYASFPVGQVVNIKAWSSSPNGVADPNALNDTTQKVNLPAFNGAYTIGKTAGFDYPSIDSAVKAMIIQGVCGPVTFNVDEDTYIGKATIPAIAGVNATNTVTFNGNGAYLIDTIKSTTLARHIVQFNGSSYITFNNFKIEAETNSLAAYAVHFTANAHHNTVKNSTIIVNQNTGSTNFIPVVFSGSNTSYSTATNCTYNVLDNNTISGGYFAITLYGPSGASHLSKGNVIKNNKIVDFYYYGVYNIYSDSTQIVSNDIYRTPGRTNLTTGTYGIYVASESKQYTISKNKIHNLYDTDPNSSGGSVYGIYMGSPSLVGKEAYVTNNAIYNLNTRHSIYPLYNSGAGNINIHHNTVSADATSINPGIIYGFYQSGAVSGIDMKNNIFSLGQIATTKYVYYLATPATSIITDNNALYFPKGNIAYFNGAPVTTLNDWATNNALFDQYSVEANPAFINEINPIPTSSLINNIGEYAGVSTDITGAARPTATPDPGAYEFSTVNLDAEVTFLPSVQICSGPTDVKAKVRNVGTANILTFQMNWSVNGVLQTPVTFSSDTLVNGEDSLMTLGSFNFASASTNVIKVWTSAPNGGTDVNHANDTVQTTLKTGLQGTYTIGGAGSDYATMTAAVTALNTWGICGPVVFNVDPTEGPYNEQITINEIANASATNTVKFFGHGAEMNFVSYNPGSPHVIRLNGADYVTIDSFILRTGNNNDNVYGWGVHLTNASNNNRVSNCQIYTDVLKASSNYAGIVISGSNTSPTTTANSKLNVFENNTVEGGYYGITLYGSSSQTSGTIGNAFINNKIRNYYYYGLYTYYNDSTQYIGNEISRPTRSVVTTTVYGLMCGYGSNHLIANNKIHDLYGAAPSTAGTGYGLYIINPTGKETIVKNNMIYNNKSNGSFYGIYNSQGANTKYYHNTISYDQAGTSTGTIYGYFQTSAPSGPIELKNNIISLSTNATNKYALYFATYASFFSSDRNDLYVPNGNIGYASANKASMSDWQATGFDSLSVNADPFYESILTGSLKPTSSVVNNKATLIPTVPTDINGVIRNVTTPDMGAIEFTPLTIDAGLIAYTSPVAPCVGNNDVIVQLANYGVTAITSLTINWTVNGVAQPAYPYTGFLPEGSITDVNLGAFGVTSGPSYIIKSWVTAPNGLTDANPINDTATITGMQSALSGTYTVGGVTPNYATLTAAIASLHARGVCGPVTFNIAPGVYTEQITINAIKGAGPASRVTIKGNGAEFKFVSSSSEDRHTIRLNGASYVTLDSLVIRTATENNSSRYGWGLHLTNNASYDSVTRCHIITSDTTTLSNYMGIAITGSNTSLSATNSKFNVFQNNIITGGYYGIGIYGTSGATQNTKGNEFRNNVIRNFYVYGIYNYYTDSTLIIGNDINRTTRPLPTGTTLYGVLMGGSTNGLVEGNRLYNLFAKNPALSGGTAYLLYVTGAGVAGKPLQFINNAIYNNASNYNIYSIYNTGGTHVNIYNNSISFDNTTKSSGAIYGIYHSGAGTGVDVKNNLISISQPATVKYGHYLATVATTVAMNYNDIYVPNGNVAYYNNVTYTSLAAWKSGAGSMYDQNSYDIQPNWKSNQNVIPTAAILNDMGTPLTPVVYDIVGTPRNPSTPDIGAYEFESLLNDAGLVTFESPTAPCFGPNIVTVTLANPSSLPLASATLNWSINGTIQPPVNYVGNLASGMTESVLLDTITMTFGNSYDIRAWVTAPNGGLDDNNNNDTIKTATLKGGLSGTYTVGGAGADFLNLSLAMDELNTAGLCGPVVFNVNAAAGPYTEQVSIGEVRGVSAVNTITLKGNGAEIRLLTNTSSDKRAIFKLDGADYVTIDSFLIRTPSGSTSNYGWGIHLTNGTNYNTIKGCTIITDQLTTGTNYAGIVVSGSTTSATTATSAKFNKFINNTISGGYYGITIYGTSGSQTATQGNEIIGNAIKNFYYYGIQNYANDSTIIVGNDFSCADRTALSTFRYIMYNATTPYVFVSGNKIHNLFDQNPSLSGTVYGYYFSSVASRAGRESIVKNNAIYSVNSTASSFYAIYNASSDSMRIYHNTVSFDSPQPSSGTIYGIYQTGAVKSLEIYNNAISISQAGAGVKYGMYFGTNTSVITSDYNEIFVPNGNVGYWNAKAYLTLADWQSLNLFDFTSISQDPLFNSQTKIIPKTGSPLVASGTPIAAVTSDIVGVTRNATNPTIGAYESSGIFTGPAILFEPIPNTTLTTNRTLNAFAKITHPLGVDTAFARRPRLYYKKSTHANTIADNTSATNGWKYVVATGTTSPYSFVIDNALLSGGSVAAGDKIQYFIVAQDSTGYIASREASFYSEPASMTLTTANFPVSGATTYTIGTSISDTLFVGNGKQFTSLTKEGGAFQYINDNVVTGNIAIILSSNMAEDGTYGLNPLSESGAGNYKVDIKPNTNTIRTVAGTYPGGLIRLNGVDRVTFDGSGTNNGRYLKIVNTSLAGNTAAIQLIGTSSSNGSSYNTIKNSIIYTSTAANAIGIHIGGPTIPYSESQANNNNKILNNWIYRGSVGIFSSGSEASMNDSTIIEGNLIGHDATNNLIKLYGIAISHTKNSSVSKNTIKNITNSAAQQAYGIGLYDNVKDSKVSYNKIEKVTGGNGFGGRGIYIVTSLVNSNISVYNNFVGNISGNGNRSLSTTANVGVSIVGCGGINLYYNTVSMSAAVSKQTSAPDLSAALYVGTGAKNLRIKNNSFSNTMRNPQDSSLSYAFYSAVGDTSYLELDNNNYYVDGAQGLVGNKAGTDLVTLAALKTAYTGKNVNSISSEPFHYSAIDLHAQGVPLYQKGVTIPSITDDIDGEARNATPNIGADEFTPPSKELTAVKLIYPSGEFLCGIPSDSIVVVVQNLGLQPQSNFPIGVKVNGAFAATANAMYSGTLQPGDRDTVTIGYYNSAAALGEITIKTSSNLVGDANANNDTVTFKTKVLPIPAMPVTNATATVCKGSGAVLTATSSASNIIWYESLEGGEGLANNDTFITPVVNAPTTYYVESSNNSIKRMRVGMSDNTTGTGGNTAPTFYQVLFTVTKPITLDSIHVYPSAAGSLTINIKDGNNTTTLQTITQNISGPAGQKTAVPLGFTLAPGQYRIDAFGTPSITLWRNITGGGPYPHNSPGGEVSITSNTFNDVNYYYYFYDWRISAGTPGCASDRVPVLVTPIAPPSGTTVAKATPYSGFYNDGTSANPDGACVGGTLTYTVTPPDGFTAGDFGTKWTITNPSLLTLGDSIPKGVSSINNATLQYTVAAGDLDSTIIFKAKVKNMITGCDSSIERYLKVYSPITANLGIDKTSCDGQVVTLDAGAATAYLWSNGATTQTIGVITAGDYWVDVFSAGGCSTRDTVHVGFDPSPSVDLGADTSVCGSITLDAGNPGMTYLWSTGATTRTLKVTTSGMYTVKVTGVGTGACFRNDTVNIVVKTATPVNLGSDQSICPGDTTTLNAGTGVSYLWSTNETTQSIKVTTGGNYWVVVTGANGCEAGDTVVVTVKVAPVSTFTATPNTGNPLQVAFEAPVQNNVTYSWTFGDHIGDGTASRNPVHVYDTAGTYEVCVTVTSIATGCKSKTCSTIVVTKPVGMGNTLSQAFKLSAAPNPFNEKTSIGFELSKTSEVTLEIYDMIGRKVEVLAEKEQLNGKQTFDWNITNNNSGVYFVRLTVDGKTSILRLVNTK